MTHFGRLNSDLELANHTLVFLDAPGLVEEDGERVNHGKSFDDWNPASGGAIELVKTVEAGEFPTAPSFFSSSLT